MTNFGAPKLFLWVLPVLVVWHIYHPMQFKGKIINQTCYLPPSPPLPPPLFFSGVLLLLDVRHCRKLCLYANPSSSVTRYYGQVSSCKISEQTNDPILTKFSDGRMDESNFIRLSSSVQQKFSRTLNLYFSKTVCF